MHYTKTVTVRYGLQDLTHNLCSLVLGKSNLLLDGLEELHT
jgi:hypothetical protein